MLDFIAMALQLTSEVFACDVIKQHSARPFSFASIQHCHVSAISRARILGPFDRRRRSAYRVETGLNAAELSTRSPEVARPAPSRRHNDTRSQQSSREYQTPPFSRPGCRAAVATWPGCLTTDRPRRQRSFTARAPDAATFVKGFDGCAALDGNNTHMLCMLPYIHHAHASHRVARRRS